MIVLLDRKRFESPLINRTAARRVVMRMPALRVGDRQPSHVFRQVLIAHWPEHQVPMIGHQTETQQTHRDVLASFFEHVLKGGIVVVRAEDLLSTDGAVKDVKDVPTGTESRTSRHGWDLQEDLSTTPPSFTNGNVASTGSGVVFGRRSTIWKSVWPKTTPDPLPVRKRCSMKNLPIVFAAAAYVALVLLPALPTTAQFEEMASRVPNSANAIALINVDKVLDSPMAVAEGWREDPVKRFAAGLTSLPCDARQVLLAAQLDLASMRPLWELGMVAVDHAPSAADLAAQHNGVPDAVAGLPAVQLPDNSYVVRLSDTLLGAHAPGNRQAVSRWLRESHGGLPPYLEEAVGYAQQGTEFVVAVDLQDAVALRDALAQLEGVDNPVLNAATIDSGELAELLASVQGVMLGVTFGERAFGMIKLDFGRDASMLAGIVHPLFLAILEQRGLMIDEFYDWKAKVEGPRVMFGGYLTGSGLMRLTSLLDLPSQALHSAGRTRWSTAAPAGGQSPDEGIPAAQSAGAEGAIAPETSGVASAGDLQDIVEPTRQYFQKVGHLLSDLRSRKRGAGTFGQIGVWYERYARRVDRLPMASVDDQMLDYGGYVGNRLRIASAAIHSGGVQSRLGQIAAVREGVPVSWFEQDVRRPMTLREEAAARAHARTYARTEAGATVQQIEREIDAATAEIRRLMAKKYQVDM